MERANEINTYNNIDTFEYDLQEMKYQECLKKELEQKVPQQINQDIINGIVILILEENEQAERWLLLIDRPLRGRVSVAKYPLIVWRP